MFAKSQIERAWYRVRRQESQNRIQCRCLSFARASVLTAFATLVACTHQHSAALFPNGDDWLRWSESEREQYVSAYVEGMSEGFREGCDTALEATQPPADGQRLLEANARCADHAPFSGRNLDLFIPLVTSFFQKYPEHRKQRNLGVSRVLRSLDEGRTVEQIHVESSPQH